MAKKMNLSELNVKSFITVTEGTDVKGGTDSINTGRLCSAFVLCGSRFDCSEAQICNTNQC